MVSDQIQHLVEIVWDKNNIELKCYQIKLTFSWNGIR